MDQTNGAKSKTPQEGHWYFKEKPETTRNSAQGRPHSKKGRCSNERKQKKKGRPWQTDDEQGLCDLPLGNAGAWMGTSSRAGTVPGEAGPVYGAGPVPGEISPAPGGASPVSRGACSGQRGTGSVSRGACAGQRGGSPVSRGACAGQRGAGPVARGAAPGQRGAGPFSKGAGPGQRGAGPVSRGAGSVQRGAGPVSKGADPVQRGAGAVQKVASLVQSEAVPSESSIEDSGEPSQPYGNSSDIQYKGSTDSSDLHNVSDQVLSGDVRCFKDVLSNDALEQLLSDLNSTAVPMKEAQHAEFTFRMNYDFRLTVSNRDRVSQSAYYLQMGRLGRLICAMLNTSGGVIWLLKTGEYTPREYDSWEDKLSQYLKCFIADSDYQTSIAIEEKTPDFVEIIVNRAAALVTFESNLFHREKASTSEVRLHLSIKSLLFKSQETGQPLNSYSVPNVTELRYNEPFKYEENIKTEFKCYYVGNAEELVDRIKQDCLKNRTVTVIEKSLFAFANSVHGGSVFIGIHENQTTGVKTVQGQPVTADEIPTLTSDINKMMKVNLITGQRRIWNSENYDPQQGKEWDVLFHPVVNTDGNIQRFVIQINVKPFNGKVFAAMPESYWINDSGVVELITFDKWRDAHKPIEPIKSLQRASPSKKRVSIHTANYCQQDMKDLAVLLEKHCHKHHQKPTNKASMSWTKHSVPWRTDQNTTPSLQLKDKIPDLAKSDLLQPVFPVRFTPSALSLNKSLETGDTVEKIIETLFSGKKAAVLSFRRMLDGFQNDCHVVSSKQHVLDLIVLTQESISLISVEKSLAQTKKKIQEAYVKKSLCTLKKHMHLAWAKLKSSDTSAGKLTVKTQGYLWGLDENNSLAVTGSVPERANVSLENQQQALASLLLEGRTYMRDRFGEKYLLMLTKQQIEVMLSYDKHDISIIRGPPGSGKTIMGLHIFERYQNQQHVSKENLLYVCPNKELKAFADMQGTCQAILSENCLQFLLDGDAAYFDCIVVDDAHNMTYTKEQWFVLFDHCLIHDIKLYIFIDSTYQNFKSDETDSIIELAHQYQKEHTKEDFSIHIFPKLQEMLRNGRKIFSFFKANAGSEYLECKHPYEGEDVCIHRLDKLFDKTDNNPVLCLAKEFVYGGISSVREGSTHEPKQIAILIDTEEESLHFKVEFYRKLFMEHFPEACVQSASEFPVKGLVIDKLTAFSGLDAEVVLFVSTHTASDSEILKNYKYWLFVASRAITRVDFILRKPVTDVAEQMHFSGEQIWMASVEQLLGKLTRVLLTADPESSVYCRPPDPTVVQTWINCHIPDTWWEKPNACILPVLKTVFQQIAQCCPDQRKAKLEAWCAAFLSRTDWRPQMVRAYASIAFRVTCAKCSDIKYFLNYLDIHWITNAGPSVQAEVYKGIIDETTESDLGQDFDQVNSVFMGILLRKVLSSSSYDYWRGNQNEQVLEKTKSILENMKLISELEQMVSDKASASEIVKALKSVDRTWKDHLTIHLIAAYEKHLKVLIDAGSTEDVIFDWLTGYIIEDCKDAVLTYYGKVLSDVMENLYSVGMQSGEMKQWVSTHVPVTKLSSVGMFRMTALHLIESVLDKSQSRGDLNHDRLVAYLMLLSPAAIDDQVACLHQLHRCFMENNFTSSWLLDLLAVMLDCWVIDRLAFIQWCPLLEQEDIYQDLTMLKDSKCTENVLKTKLGELLEKQVGLMRVQDWIDRNVPSVHRLSVDDHYVETLCVLLENCKVCDKSEDGVTQWMDFNVPSHMIRTIMSHYGSLLVDVLTDKHFECGYTPSSMKDWVQHHVPRTARHFKEALTSYIHTACVKSHTGHTVEVSVLAEYLDWISLKSEEEIDCLQTLCSSLHCLEVNQEMITEIVNVLVDKDIISEYSHLTWSDMSDEY